MHIRLLRDIEGSRYLIPDENCTIEVEKLDEMAEEQKSSMYWLEYTDHKNQLVKTDKRCYIKHFQVVENEEKKTGRTDFEFKLRLVEAPSIELRDWLQNDLIMTLYESRPKLEREPHEEGAEPNPERVVLDKDGLPVIETINRGITKVNFAHWLKKSPAQPKYQSSQKKKNVQQSDADQAVDKGEEANKDQVLHQFKYFYSEDLMCVPEYLFEDKITQIKPKEVKMLEEYLEEKEAEDARRKAEEPGSANPAAGKKDAKKDPKAAAAKGKGAAPAEDKNSPQLITVEYPEEKATADVNYLVYERQFDAQFGDDPETKAALDKKGVPSSTLDLLGNGDKKNPYGAFGEKYKEKGKQLI